MIAKFVRFVLHAIWADNEKEGLAERWKNVKHEKGAEGKKGIKEEKGR